MLGGVLQRSPKDGGTVTRGRRGGRVSCNQALVHAAGCGERWIGGPGKEQCEVTVPGAVAQRLCGGFNSVNLT